MPPFNAQFSTQPALGFQTHATLLERMQPQSLLTRRYPYGLGLGNAASPLPASSLGAISLHSVAASVGTDEKTFLLLAGGGIVAGYLLNNALKAASRGARRTRRKVGKALLGSPERTAGTAVGTIVLVGLAAAGGYWLYRQVQKNKSAAPSRAALPAYYGQGHTPVLRNGHWTRP